ncbi:hypothetical protein [Thermoflexus sp.]|uniref:hypothetical protein n=1 Tax=Thermoflexus sp. TaxID=1969742 RepID=UPI00175F88F2|nr:hypothetical protein [Thermoflexus sp.]
MPVRLVPSDRPWVRMTMGAAEVAEDAEGLRLTLFPNPGDRYADAQIDDYGGTGFIWRPPVQLLIEARFSHPAASLVGTAGFGFWNAGAPPGTATGLPSAVWFFFASSPSRVALDPSDPGRGWLAMVWRSPGGPRIPWPAPLIRGLQRLLDHPVLSRATLAASRRWIMVSQRPIPVDMTQWHGYGIRWMHEEVLFEMDGKEIHRAPFAPAGPLGFVAWIDNQFLSLDPDAGISSGFLAVREIQSMILRRVEINRMVPKLSFLPSPIPT